MQGINPGVSAERGKAHQCTIRQRLGGAPPTAISQSLPLLVPQHSALRSLIPRSLTQFGNGGGNKLGHFRKLSTG